MLNTDVKKQINTARDILVGKIPDPKGQIDQITNALIYKFMDDQDRLSQTLPGGKATFFIDELAPYAWHKLFDTKLSNQDRANLYVEGIAKLSKAKNLPELFRDIFKDAFLPFRDADTIAMFLNEINKFDYHHSEDLGNAFEYLLSIMGSQGDAGQFRTPRNIIEFIVDAVNPTKDESILDPACGTAGFLVEAYKHITTDKKLSPNEVQELAKHIHGVDIDPGMGKIARVNLYLHGFKTPMITEDDTLTNDTLWGKKYDVILANPPFMTPKGGIKPHDKFSVQSNRAEVLFTDYIAEHLKLAGRAGIVVPEGIIFQSSNAYKQLRKMLVEDNYLWGVISLPAGVFNPYSGVKTSILLLDRARAKENTEIMFYKVEDDGFGLGAQRRESKKNDLPEALNVIEQWREGKKLEVAKVSYVEKETIAEDGDYNLSVDRYQVAVDYANVKWPIVKLGDISEIQKGTSITKKSADTNGKIPVVAGGQTYAYYHSEPNRKKGSITVSASGAYSGFVWYHPYEIWASDCSTIIANQGVSQKYLYFVLKSKQDDIYKLQKGGGQPHVYPKDLEKIKIPLPPLEIQEQIVAELDGYQHIIDGAKQIVDNWKPKIDIDPEWEKVKLGEVCEIYGGGTPSRKEEKYWSGDIPWISARYFSDDHTINGAEMITKEGLLNSSAKVAPKGSTILITRVSVGKFAIADQDYAINQDLTAVVSKDERLDSRYLLLISEMVAESIKKNAVGVGVTGVTRDFVTKYEIPLPSLETQKQIVEQIEAERELVESAKKLIEIYEGRVKEVVDGLWDE